MGRDETMETERRAGPATGDLDAFLGPGFVTTPLKRWQTRLRNRLKPWLIRLPRRAMAYLVEASDGRRFKLIRGSFEEELALQTARTADEMLSDYDHVPRLKWRGEKELLFEFIEGTEPDVTTSEFAAKLGVAYAGLHRTNHGQMERGQLHDQYACNFDSLIEKGLLSGSDRERFDARVEDGLPERIDTGMVCVDPKGENFIVDPTGRLYFIDVVSLKAGLPVDPYLVGSNMFGQIEQAMFEKSYRDAGGVDYLLHARDTLTLLELTRRCDQEVRVLAGTRRIDARRRGVFRGRIESRIEEIRSLLDPGRGR